MIRLFKRLFTRVFTKTQPEPVQAMQELLELTTKAARRCAYDLAHAVDQMPDAEERRLYGDRARHWLSIFNPANGPKDYRARLHNQLFRLEQHIERLERQLRDAGITPDDDFWGPTS